MYHLGSANIKLIDISFSVVKIWLALHSINLFRECGVEYGDFFLQATNWAFRLFEFFPRPFVCLHLCSWKKFNFNHILNTVTYRPQFLIPPNKRAKLVQRGVICNLYFIDAFFEMEEFHANASLIWWTRSNFNHRKASDNRHVP